MPTPRKKHPGGRPKGLHPRLQQVTFRADQSVLGALDALTSAAAAAIQGMAMNGARSLAIRRAILEAAARLKAKGGAE